MRYMVDQQEDIETLNRDGEILNTHLTLIRRFANTKDQRSSRDRLNILRQP